MKTNKNFFCQRFILIACGILLSILAQAQTFIDEDFLDKIEANASFMLNEPDAAFKNN